MKIEISSAKKIQLESNLNNMLFGNGRVYVLDSIKIEEEVVEYKGGWFSQPRKVKTYFVTDAEVHMWHSQAKGVGILNERATIEIIEEADFHLLRRNWLMMKEQIEGFGFKINAIEKPVLETEQS